MPPDTAADGFRCPGTHVIRIIDMHADHPAVKQVAITIKRGVRHVYDSVYKSQCAPFLLYRCGKRRYRRAHIHRPAGIDRAGIHVQRIDKMFLCLTTVGSSHCVKEKRARGKIDNGGAEDAHWINIGTWHTGYRHGRAKISLVSLPNYGTGIGMQRVHIVRCGHDNDHRAVWTALDIERLRVNVT